MIRVTARQGAASFPVRVIPRAGRTAVGGVRHGALLVRLAAPPVEGAANDALVAFLSRVLERPARDVAIVAGHKSRDKTVAVSDMSVDQLAGILSAILHA